MRRVVGFTLLELLIVLTLLASLMGVGVGVFGQLNLANQGVPGAVKSVLRSARSLALTEGAPARVSFDAKEGKLRAVGLRNVGQWHFEDEGLEGAFGVSGISHGAEISPEGRIGSCLIFSGTGAAWVEFPVGALSRYQGQEGIACEFDLNLSRLSNGVLVQRLGSFSLSLGSEGQLKASVNLDGATSQGGGRNFAETRPGVLQPHRWQHLLFIYDRRKIRIYVDGVEEGAVDERAPLRVSPEPILISDTSLKFEGRFDELRISAVVQGESVSLPKGVELQTKTPEIQFDPAGNLDTLAHSDSVIWSLVYENGKKVDIELGVYGTIR